MNTPAATSTAWDRLQAALKLPAVRDQPGPPAVTNGGESGMVALQSSIADLLWGNRTHSREDPPGTVNAFIGPNGV